MVTIKSVKKKFFEVKLPLTATKVHLLAKTPEELEGSVIKLDLTRNLRGKNLELKIRVHYKNGELEGEPTSMLLLGSYIRRAMRKGADYVEDSFEAECRDAILRIKPFMITRKKVSRAIRKSLRNNARKFLESHIKIHTLDEILSQIMANKLQKELSLKLKKIYPLAFCEIRVIELIKRKDAPVIEAKE